MFFLQFHSMASTSSVLVLSTREGRVGLHKWVESWSRDWDSESSDSGGTDESVTSCTRRGFFSCAGDSAIDCELVTLSVSELLGDSLLELSIAVTGSCDNLFSVSGCGLEAAAEVGGVFSREGVEKDSMRVVRILRFPLTSLFTPTAASSLEPAAVGSALSLGLVSPSISLSLCVPAIPSPPMAPSVDVMTFSVTLALGTIVALVSSAVLLVSTVPVPLTVCDSVPLGLMDDGYSSAGNAAPSSPGSKVTMEQYASDDVTIRTRPSSDLQVESVLITGCPN